MYNFSSDDTTLEPPRSLRSFAVVLFKHKRLILSFFVFVVGTVALGSFIMSPVFQASSKVLVERELDSEKALLFRMDLTARYENYDWLSSELEIIKSHPLAARVVKALQLEQPEPNPKASDLMISNVTASTLTATSALINWTTNEASDSQVEHGATTVYGNATTLDAALVMSHAVALNNLQANTTYHYRVKSRDAAGNLVVSGDFSFTTLAPPSAIFADDFNTGSLDGNKWRRGTNAGNAAAVKNNALELSAQGAESGWVITRTTYAAKHLTVSLKVVQPNDDGDLGVSPTFNLASKHGIYDQANWYRFYTNRNGKSGPYHLYVQWKKSGVDNGLDVTGNLVINGAVYLRLRFDDTKIHFEASFDGTAWTDTYNETFALPGYTLDSLYYYELAGYHTNSKGVLTVDDFALNHNSSAPDTLPPQISQAAANNLTAMSATINWTTNEASDSQVEYGLTTGYGKTTPLEAALVTSHALALENLQASRTYHYRVKSKDAAGNLAVSGDFTFNTLAYARASATRFEKAVLDFQSELKAENLGKSNVIEISYNSKDPRLVAAVVNEVVSTYINYRAELFDESSAYKFFEEQMGIADQKLRALEQSQAKFKQQEEVLSPEEHRQILVTKLTDYEKSLTIVRTQRIGKEAKLTEIKAQRKKGQSINIPATETSDSPSRDKYIAKLKGDLLDMEIQRERLLQKFTPQYEEVVNLNKQIAATKAKITGEIREIVGIETTAIRALQAEENALQASIDTIRNEIRDFAQKEFEYSQLSRGIDDSREVYSTLLKQREEARLSLAKLEGGVKIKVISPATAPLDPVKPRKKIYIALAVLLGLMGGLGLAFLVERFDHAIGTPAELEKLVGLPVLGSVREIQAGAPSGKTRS